MTLATLAELKGRLGITDSADDTTLGAHMQRVEDRMAAHCGRVWAVGAQVETFAPPLGWLLLMAWPVVSVTSLTVDGVAQVANEDYRLVANRGRIEHLLDNGMWIDGFEIVVTYRGGFATAGTTPAAGDTLPPPELTAALLTQAEWEWRNKPVLGLKSASQGGVSVAAADFDWLPAVREAMGPHRRFG